MSAGVRDIAAAAGCSPATVSRVLSGRAGPVGVSAETKKRILDICAELDYQPSVHASRLNAKKAGCVGFLPPRNFFVMDENLARSMNTVFYSLSRRSYRCLPVINDGRFVSEKLWLSLFRRREIDGLIVWGAEDDYTWLRELRDKDFPFALLANSLDPDFPSVTCGDRAGTAAMTRRCVERGASKLVYLDIGGSGACLKRREGFLEAAAGPGAKIIRAGTGVEDGENAAGAVLRISPDAVICGNDKCAFGLERALLKKGARVPDDIMITGGDNIELSGLAPVPLTTFDQMAEKCAAKCVEILLDKIERGAEPGSAVFEPEIHIRDSA